MLSARKLNLSQNSRLSLSAQACEEWLLEVDPSSSEQQVYVELGAYAQLTLALGTADLASPSSAQGSAPQVNVHLKLQEGAKLFGLFQTAGHGCGLTCHVALEGPAAQAQLFGFSHLKGAETSKQDYIIAHHAPQCSSQVLYKSVLDDKARGHFRTHVTVHEHASGTSASQYVHTLVLNRGARQLTQPELRIYNDDVVCQHGATVGALDEQALLYLTSRHIPLQAARGLLIQAFFNDFAEQLATCNPFLRSQLCL